MQENNRSELERLDKERHDDFMGMLRGFVANQVPYFYVGYMLSWSWQYVGNGLDLLHCFTLQ